MKRLLRSILDFKTEATQEQLVSNFQKLLTSTFEWQRPDDARLYEFARTYFQQHMEMPSYTTVQDYFSRTDDIEVLERLKEVAAAQSYVRTNFIHLLQTLLDEQNKIRAVALLQETKDIITKGLVIDKQRHFGVREGILHFSGKANDLIVPESNARLRGDLRREGQAVWDQYLVAKHNKGRVWGRFTGINAVDTVCHGAKNGDLWIHAAYAGELKCLPGDATVFDHKANRRRTLQEMFESSTLPVVTALDREGATFRLLEAPCSHLVQNGERDVFDLRLASGRRVGATANHKFFTPEGWCQLGDLRAGDFVAVPKKMHVVGSDALSEAEVQLAGYLLGVGALDESVDLSFVSASVRMGITDALAALGFHGGLADVIPALKSRLEALGIWGLTQKVRHIPHVFWGLSERLIAAFLSALWSTSERATGSSTFVSDSERLCLDGQSLLLRLGIQSTVTSMGMFDQGMPFTLYSLRVTGEESESLFATKVIPSRKADSIPDTVKPNAGRIPQTKNGDLNWERVEEVSLRGKEMTYDLSVPVHHTFVVNDIVSHNTTFATTWCYNLVTRYQTNVFYASLEMKFEHIRLLMYVMHSSNAKWTTQGYKPLDYRKTRDGDLTDEEERFFQMVIDDFSNNPDYGEFEVWAPDRDVTVADIRMEAELLHKQMEIGMTVIDHGGLVLPSKPSRDYNVEINSVMRDAKKFALQFNHGEGMAVLLLHQINRDGKDYADKNEGEYKLRALSYANEAERSADIVTTTYLNKELRDDETTIMCNLKNRDNPLFDTFRARVNFGVRRLLNADQSVGNGLSTDDMTEVLNEMYNV